uniref:Ribosomal protein S20 n=1 Tax=Pleonosporium borreri TaxID=2575635 RepID=A0A4D6WXI1_9FLOR|nr:ribosomal protein S20 [Pleonosporium borreri]
MKKNLSAIKRTQLSLRNRSRNKSYKIAINKSIKKFLLSIDNMHDKEYLSSLSIAYKKIDKAVSKGVIHKNKGARKKSQLTKLLYKN